MKKFTTTLLLAIGLLVGFTVNAQAVSAATLNMSYSDYWYDRAKADGSEHHSWHFTLYDMDGEVAYCIQPNVKEGTHYNQGSWEDTGLPNSIKERILLIGYYGYTYPGHQTLQFRAATQGMIWDTIVGGGANTTFHTARWAKGDTFDVSNEKAQIEELIAHHYDRPSFNGGVYKAQVGETITLTDTNNVLSNYSVSVSGADYSIDGNKLIIKPTRSGSIDLTLTKNMPYSSSYKLFVGDGIQNMMVPGTTDPVIAKIRVNSYTAFVEGHKKDSETGKAQGQATLKGAEYGVYETSTGRLVTTVVTDENGYFKSNAVLSWNDYYLQEIKPSEGYELDTTRYNVDIKGKESASVDVVEKVIKNYVSILKQYEQVDGNTTFLNAEKGITFEIYYPNGNKYGEITTDKNGYASLNLPYGVWKFHQVNTTTGYEKIYDFYITVNETSEKEQYYNILNNTLYAYLQVIKVDSETGKTIAIANTTFKILNTDTNQYVSQYVGGKVYSEFKTDENGKMITYLKLPAGNYKLIEVSAPNGYLKDKDGLKFTIGNDTHYSYTTYGAFITVTYKNTPIKGQLEIKKTGENLVIKDGKYTYKDKKLSGVTFEIYAEEDIKSADGNHLYYEKSTKIQLYSGKINSSVAAENFDINVSSGSADISSRTHKHNNVNVSVLSGKTTLDGFISEKSKYSLTSGKIASLNAGGGELYTNVTSGLLTLGCAEKIAGIDAKVASGKAHISAPKDTGARVAYSVASGSIKIGLDGRNEKLTGSGSISYGNAEANVNVNVASGNFILDTYTLSE